MNSNQLEHLDCRGADVREQIVKDYNIECIAYRKLLNGQEKVSDAKDKLTDRYFQFICTSKTDENKKYLIECGVYAGKHLLSLLGTEPPEFFDPLISAPKINQNNSKQKNSESCNKVDKGTDDWHPLAFELFIAINILIEVWRIIPQGKLLDIKQKVEQYYRYAPFPDRVCYVNAVIGKDAERRTLVQMIEELRNRGNDIKDFKFPLMEKC